MTSREELIDAEVFKIESTHHFHGDTCLCGFTSPRSRSRTEHITGLMRAVFEQAHTPTDDGHDGWCGCEKCGTEPQGEPTDAAEPEWEYGRRCDATGYTTEGVYSAEKAASGLMDGWRAVRRRKAGPWEPVEQEARRPIGPDCRDGKHPACDGRALNTDDDITDCECDCHKGGTR